MLEIRIKVDADKERPCEFNTVGRKVTANDLLMAMSYLDVIKQGLFEVLKEHFANEVGWTMKMDGDKDD